MGSDNLFHKRKAKLREDTRRRKASREAYPKILIVCEGQKTEPLYFTDIKNFHEINTANIHITGDCGTDPVSIYNYAAKLYKEELAKGDPFDQVFCVFDQDHYNLPPNTYQQALDKISNTKPANVFHAVNSVPCFEYWVLLHFVYSTAQFTTVGKVSAGAAVLQQVMHHWPAYTKGLNNVYMSLLDKLNYAKTNALRARVAATSSYTDNPTTEIDKLVEYLEKIKSKKTEV